MNDLWALLGPSLINNGGKWAIRELDGQRQSYSHLLAEVCAIEEKMAQSGLSPEATVGVLQKKSFRSVHAQLACLKSGRPYVPIDSSNPISRLSHIIDNARLSAIFTDGEVGKEVKRELARLGFINHPVDEGIDLWLRDLVGLISRKDVAFILFTSGSTGKPKGVAISHKNACCFVQWCIEEFNVRSDDVVSSIAPFHFDLSVFDLYATLSSGAEVVLFSKRTIQNPRLLTEVLCKFAVSIIYTTPTILQLLTGFGKWERHLYNELRLILFAGEVYPKSAWNKLNEIWPKTTMYNLYGPTETNVVTYHKLDPAFESNSSAPFALGLMCPYAKGNIGEPGNNGQLEEGVLWISGDSVSPGYIDSSVTESDKFVRIDETYWYNTGDLVRRLENGMLVYVGRADRMIKRYGNRVELGEIESAALRMPGVDVAAVVCLKKKDKMTLTLFLVAKNGEKQRDMFEVLAHLKTNLPDYMIPDKVHWMDHLPLTSNHKTDYTRLKEVAKNA